MFTFLPQEHKKKVQGVYHTHLLVLSLCGILVLVLFSVLVAFPSFLSARTKRISAELELGTFTSSVDGTSAKDVELLIVNSQEKITTTNEYLETTYLTDVLLSVLKHKTSAIKINLLSLERSGQMLSLSGIATDRTSLLEFVKVLRNDPSFEIIDFPISTLVKPQKVDFTITLHVRKLQ